MLSRVSALGVNKSEVRLDKVFVWIVTIKIIWYLIYLIPAPFAGVGQCDFYAYDGKNCYKNTYYAYDNANECKRVLIYPLGDITGNKKYRCHKLLVVLLFIY